MVYISFLNTKENATCDSSYCQNIANFSYFVFDKKTCQVWIYNRCLNHKRNFTDDDLIEHPKFILKMLKNTKEKMIIHSKHVSSVKEIELLLNKSE